MANALLAGAISLNSEPSASPAALQDQEMRRSQCGEVWDHGPRSPRRRGQGATVTRPQATREPTDRTVRRDACPALVCGL